MTDSVVICIPTFKRPKMLKRLLTAIAELHTNAKISVVVADNDAHEHAGFNLCQSLTNYRWPLTAIVAQQRGIAQVRNALIDQALKSDAQFIAMIDDDEWPQPDWIEKFLACARQTNADVLQGSILFGWGQAADGHGDIRRPTGPIDMLQGAGNLLIRRSVLEAIPPPWFDPAFALTGGEDRDFFVRLSRAGKTFAWSDEARAHGDIPQSRANLAWLLRRAYSVGNSDMLVFLKYRPGPFNFLVEILKILASLLLSPFAAVILAASPNRRAIPLQKLFRTAGKLSALAGKRYKEYVVIHGE